MKSTRMPQMSTWSRVYIMRLSTRQQAEATTTLCFQTFQNFGTSDTSGFFASMYDL